MRRDKRVDCCVAALPTLGISDMAYNNLDFRDRNLYNWIRKVGLGNLAENILSCGLLGWLEMGYQITNINI